MKNYKGLFDRQQNWYILIILSNTQNLNYSMLFGTRMPKSV